MKLLQNIRITIILLITFAGSLLLVACNMPGRATPTRVGLAPISTFAAQNDHASAHPRTRADNHSRRAYFQPFLQYGKIRQRRQHTR
jgi:hypothetical protein